MHMLIDFSGLFHRSTKDLTEGGARFISQDDSQWPDSWKTTYYKTYEADKIMLEDPALQADLFEAITNRRSRRDFNKRSLSKRDISAVLKYSCGITKNVGGVNVRAQPSAGARYPIEVYPIVLVGSEEVPAGVYHYDVKDHALDALCQRQFSPEDISELVTYDFARSASCAFVMTAVFERTQDKYGSRGYRYLMIEAGHISQNLYLVSEALGVKCCAMAGVQDEAFEKLLDIDGVTESVVHGLLLG